MAPSDIGSEKYVSLTTYRADGSAKALPVWIADLGDGTVGFTTELGTHKVRRIRNDPRIELQPCDMRGRVDVDIAPVTGTALVLEGDDATPVRAAITDKYGFQVKLIELTHRVGRLFGREPAERCAVRITLEP